MDNIDLKKIEKGVRGLVKELNKVGLKTIYSCEGHKGNEAWISIKMDNVKSVNFTGEGFTIEWSREQ